MTQNEAYIVLQRVRKTDDAASYTSSKCSQCDEYHVYYYQTVTDAKPSNFQMLRLPCGHSIFRDIAHEYYQFVRVAEVTQTNIRIDYYKAA